MAVDSSVEKLSSRKVPLRSAWSRFVDTDSYTALVFLIVPLALLVMLRFYPIVYNFYISFTSYDLSPTTQYVGFKNYIEIFTNPVMLKSIVNTLLYVIGTVPLGTILALILAALLNRPIRGRVLFRTLYYLPVVTSVAATSLVWRWIFNPQSGLVNRSLEIIGIQGPGWLTEPNTALISLIIITIWGGVGGNMVVFLAGLQGIPAELYEAAEIDGAHGWQAFWYITVPMLQPVTTFVAVTYTIAIFRSFGLIFMLTQGGPSLSTTTMVWEIYEVAFGYLRFGLGAALSVVLLAIILIISLPFRVYKMEEN